jgi:hypothetical protein
METLFRRDLSSAPRVTVVLLDWSCRESLHSLHYLNRQTVPRDRYELLWMEYFDRRDERLRRLLDEDRAAGRPPSIDQWIVLDVPRSIYYHKHLMYNVGIAAARGSIVVNCDSDAVFRPTFIQTVLDEFEKDPNIVLHLDEVRNNDRRFYPFNFPSLEEITGPGAINFARGTTTGLLDREDTLHTRNYGACMAARRDDLVAIGGADEHQDYVGHICGPYDMTFRLANLGRREIWHPTELLYHTWHPGQAGDRNYLGPHDGRHMSTTALSVRSTGRTLPLVENPAVRALRLREDGDLYAPLLDLAMPVRDFDSWTVEALEGRRTAPPVRRGARLSLPLAWVFLKVFCRYFLMKVRRFSRRARLRDLLGKALKAFTFARDTAGYVADMIARVRACVEDLSARGVGEVAVYGRGAVVDIVDALKPRHGLRVRVLADILPERPPDGMLPVEAAPFLACPIIIGTVLESNDRVVRLMNLGVPRDRILVLD